MCMHLQVYTVKEYTLEESKSRQMDICGRMEEMINGLMSGNGLVVFINVIPHGPCHIQTYTTSPS